MAAGRDRPGGVEEDRVAPAAVRAGEHVADRLCVLLGRAAAKLLRCAAGHAEVERVDLALAHVAVHDLADEVRAGRRELVDPGGAVDDERPLRTEGGEHVGDRPDEVGGVDPDDLGPGAGRVRQRPEDVEDGPRRELLPHRRRVLHRRMVGRGEQEAEAELVDRLRDPVGRQLEREAERLEHVGRARGRRHGAVAVLRDPGAGGGRHQRGCGRDVERPSAVAAGPGGVDEVVPLRAHRQHVGSHRLGAARDLLRRLALQPSATRKAADQRRRGLAAHDRVHRLARLGPGQVVPVEEPSEGVLHHDRSRKFRARSEPTGVSTDSGWNWTPSTGSSRWRTPITSPSAQVARDFELVGDRGRGERVVAAGKEVGREPVEQALAVVADQARLPVDERLRAADLAAECLDDRLVPEADAERRRARRQPPDDLRHRAGIRRPSGPGGDDEVGRSELLCFVGVDRVVPPDVDLRAQLAEQVREVVRERVVVVDRAGSRARLRELDRALERGQLARHSSCSALGDESATMPAPACR